MYMEPEWTRAGTWKFQVKNSDSGLIRTKSESTESWIWPSEWLPGASKLHRKIAAANFHQQEFSENYCWESLSTSRAPHGERIPATYLKLFVANRSPSSQRTMEMLAKFIPFTVANKLFFSGCQMCQIVTNHCCFIVINCLQLSISS